MRKPVNSKLIVAGFALTSLGIVLRVAIRWPLLDENIAHGHNWVSWEPSRCLDESPLSFGLFVIGLLATVYGVSMWGSKAALSRVTVYGLASVVLAPIALANPVLRCIAVIPLFAAILAGTILLLIALVRFILARLFRRVSRIP